MSRGPMIKCHCGVAIHPTVQDHSEHYSKQKDFIACQKKFGSAYAQSLRKCSKIEIPAKIEGKESKKLSKIHQQHIR
jgi:hypothetical protein